MLRLHNRSFWLALLVASFTACADAPDPAAEVPSPAAPDAALDTLASGPEVEPERLRAFETALDSLDALVRTLERIEGPIAAWNRAGEAARLLQYLEQNRNAFALDMSEAEAARRYPQQIGRLNALEARRTAELQRINKDPATAQVLLEEMAKESAEVDTAGS